MSELKALAREEERFGLVIPDEEVVLDEMSTLQKMAVVVATLSMFANFLWIPYNPVAACVLLALDFFVMWAAFADLDRSVP